MIPWADSIRNNIWLKVFSFALAMLIWFTVRSPTPKEIGLPTWSLWKDVADRSFTNMPVVLLILPDQGQRFTIYPATADIIVKGSPDTINRLSRSDLKVYAQIVDFNFPLGAFPLKIVLPQGVTLLSINPSSVIVESTPEPFRIFPQTPIK